MDQMNNNSVILLTACINPNGMPYTTLQDCDVRKQQYIDALHFYLDNSRAKVVFIENSAYDLSTDFKDYIDKGALEVLCFDGNHFDKARGKGYGEALIIAYGLSHSCFLRNTGQIIKITGRLKCQNINRVIEKCKEPNTVYAWLTLDESNNPICDSRVFVAPGSFWEFYFLQNMENINDSKHYYFEHLLFDASREWLRDKGRFKEICFPTEIEGVGGSTGEVYSKSNSDSLRFYLHYLLHKCGYYAPIKFWIK